MHIMHIGQLLIARHLLQVHVSYWLVNGTGLTLQFKRRKQLTPAKDDPHAASGVIGAADDDSSRGVAASSARSELTIGERTSSDPIADLGDGGDEEGEDDTVSNQAEAEAEAEHGLEGDASDQQTLLYAVPKGGKSGLHCIAVRVDDHAAPFHGPTARVTAPSHGGADASWTRRKGRRPSADGMHAGAITDGGWSPPFSLRLGPFSAEKSFRAGAYDLAVDIRPVETAARETTKVVTVVQRFWLHNRLELAVEVEQWGPNGVRLEQPIYPLAADEVRASA